MNDDTTLKRRVFLIRTLNRPGVLTSVASVFSDRGVSLEDTVGGGDGAAEEVRLIVGFRAGDATAGRLLRSLRRLERVLAVEERPFDAADLRAVASVRLKPAAADAPVAADVHAERVSRDDTGSVYLLSGPTLAVERTVEEWRGRGWVEAVLKTVLAV